MLKFLTGVVAGFALAFLVVFAVNPANSNDDGTSHMKDGSYTAYHIQKMFDGRTGEPVFWVVGGKGRKEWLADFKSELYIEPNEIKVFSIPRSKLAGLADVPSPRDYRIDVVDGVGHIVHR